MYSQFKKTVNVRDRVIQTHFPTVMVPLYEDLLPCESGKSRLLAARDGLYFDTSLPWGNFTKRIFESPVPLPYGTVFEKNTMELSARKILTLIELHMIDNIISYAQDDLEWFGAIAWNGIEFVPITPEFSSSSCAVNYSYETIPSDILIVADIHSHGCGRAFFSLKDNQDDAMGIKMAFVVGECCNKENSATVIWRYCINRFVFEGGKEVLWKNSTN